MVCKRTYFCDQHPAVICVSKQWSAERWRSPSNWSSLKKGHGFLQRVLIVRFRWAICIRRAHAIADDCVTQILLHYSNFNAMNAIWNCLHECNKSIVNRKFKFKTPLSLVNLLLDLFNIHSIRRICP